MGQHLQLASGQGVENDPPVVDWRRRGCNVPGHLRWQEYGVEDACFHADLALRQCAEVVVDECLAHGFGKGAFVGLDDEHKLSSRPPAPFYLLVDDLKHRGIEILEVFDIGGLEVGPGCGLPTGIDHRLVEAAAGGVHHNGAMGHQHMGEHEDRLRPVADLLQAAELAPDAAAFAFVFGIGE